jgi:hypothetical protein
MISQAVSLVSKIAKLLIQQFPATSGTMINEIIDTSTNCAAFPFLPFVAITFSDK